MAIAANAMGVTSGELEEMIKKGISAEEFLPKFAAELRRSVTDSGALAASLNTITAASQRLSTAFQLNVVQAFDAGAKSGIVSFLSALTGKVRTLEPFFRVLGRVAGFAFTVIADALRIISPLVSGLSTVVDMFADTLDNSLDLNKRVSELNLFEGVIRAMAIGWNVATGSLLVFIGAIDELFIRMRKMDDFVNPIGSGQGFLPRIFEQSDIIAPRAANGGASTTSIGEINFNIDNAIEDATDFAGDVMDKLSDALGLSNFANN